MLAFLVSRAVFRGQDGFSLTDCLFVPPDGFSHADHSAASPAMILKFAHSCLCSGLVHFNYSILFFTNSHIKLLLQCFQAVVV